MSQHPKELRIEDFTYALPDDRIAKYPLTERDASKLLVYENGNTSEDSYKNIADHIPAGSLIVFNQTKVVHARLLFKKPTGGVIEIFCLEPHSSYTDIPTAMQQRGQVLWGCMIGGAGKWKHGATLQLRCDEGGFTLSATIAAKEKDNYIVQFEWDDPELTFAEALHHAGKVPLPPYLHRDAVITDEERYQTIFAHDEGSVAAPTASLHFTPAIMKTLADKHIEEAFVTLHVGAGTFKPVKTQTIKDHEMHPEWIIVSSDTIKQLLNHPGKNIVAAGTTTLRTLESLYWIGNKLHQGLEIDVTSISVSQWEPYKTDTQCTVQEALLALLNYLEVKRSDKLITRTQILIAPGYEFKIVDMLVTNFHQPQSTLLLLVAAFIGDDWRKVYDYALQHDFRFLSYGDGGMLSRRK